MVMLNYYLYNIIIILLYYIYIYIADLAETKTRGVTRVTGVTAKMSVTRDALGYLT